MSNGSRRVCRTSSAPKVRGKRCRLLDSGEPLSGPGSPATLTAGRSANGPWSPHEPYSLSGCGRSDLVEAHEPRVARDISRDYGGEPASDPSWLVLLHEQHVPLPDILDEGETRRQGVVSGRQPSETPANRMPSHCRSRPAR